MSRPKGIINRKVKTQKVLYPIYDDMIANVMPKKGMILAKAKLYRELLNKFGGNRFKAAGSIGGAVNNGYIRCANNQYISIRNAHA